MKKESNFNNFNGLRQYLLFLRRSNLNIFDVAKTTLLGKRGEVKKPGKRRSINNNFYSSKRVEEKGKKDDRPTVDELVAKFDFNDPRATSLRAQLVRRLYEPGLHADLIDRAVCAAGIRWTPTSFRREPPPNRRRRVSASVG